MKINIWHYTQKGNHHSVNQDYYVYARNQWKHMLFAIADGVGSLANSQIASQNCCELLKKHFLITNFTNFTETQIRNWGENLIQKTLYSDLQQTLENVSTTLSFLIVVEKQFYVFHVGNTRIFQLKNKQIHQITNDHVQKNSTFNTFSWLKRENILNNFISNNSGCFVDFTTLPFDVEGFLLTTDGVHDFVKLSDLKQITTKPVESDKITASLENLFYQSYLSGSLDDKTCLFVRFD